MVHKKNPRIGVDKTVLFVDRTYGYSVSNWTLTPQGSTTIPLIIEPYIDLRPCPANGVGWSLSEDDQNGQSIGALWAGDAGSIDWAAMKIPPGQYTLSYGTTRTVGINLQAAPVYTNSEFFSPQPWGADSSAALTRAIAAMSAQGGGTLWLKGDYLFTNWVMPKPNVLLRAVSRNGARFIKQYNAGNYRNGFFNWTTAPANAINFGVQGVRFETADGYTSQIVIASWTPQGYTAVNSWLYQCHIGAGIKALVGGDGCGVWSCTGDPGSSVRVADGAGTDFSLDNRGNTDTLPLTFGGSDVLLYRPNMARGQGPIYAGGGGATDFIIFQPKIISVNTANNRGELILFEQPLTLSSGLIVEPHAENCDGPLLELWGVNVAGLTVLGGRMTGPSSQILVVSPWGTANCTVDGVKIVNLYASGVEQAAQVQTVANNGADKLTMTNTLFEGCTIVNRGPAQTHDQLILPVVSPPAAGQPAYTLPKAFDMPAGSGAVVNCYVDNAMVNEVF